MRISDWSSDVCSSDLKLDPPKRRFRGDGRGTDGFIAPEMESHKMCTSAIDIYSLGVTFESFAEWVPRRASVADWKAFDAMLDDMTHDDPKHRPTAAELLERSEERRVGKEGVSTCRSRWWA